MTNQSLKKQTGLLGDVKVSNKIRGFLPEEKRAGKAIK